MSPELLLVKYAQGLGTVARAGEGGVMRFLKRQLAGVGLPQFKEYMHVGGETIPQLARQVVTKPVSTLGERFKTMKPLEVGMLSAFTGMNIPELIHPVTASRGETLGTTGGMIAGWPLISRLPFIPQMAAWIAMENLGRRVGRALGGGIEPQQGMQRIMQQ